MNPHRPCFFPPNVESLWSSSLILGRLGELFLRFGCYTDTQLSANQATACTRSHQSQSWTGPCPEVPQSAASVSNFTSNRDHFCRVEGGTSRNWPRPLPQDYGRRPKWTYQYTDTERDVNFDIYPQKWTTRTHSTNSKTQQTSVATKWVSRHSKVWCLKGWTRRWKSLLKVEQIFRQLKYWAVFLSARASRQLLFPLSTASK